MDIAVWVGTGAAAASTGASWLLYYLNRGDRTLQRGDEHINHLINAKLSPVEAKVLTLDAALSSLPNTLRNMISDALEPIREALAVANSKLALMDEFWKEIAKDAAKILHQPDPEREEIDKLLEAFLAGTLSPADEARLKRFLIVIRNWEPGQDVGFPVQPGEQTAAAILLRTMHHSLDERRGRSERRGHPREEERN